MQEKSAPPVEPLCVRIPVAAAMLGIGRTKLYELMNAGEVETVKLGKSRLVVTQSIHALIARNRQCSP
jgi:excisionase family DNA binding protein